jgi:hypothetical protein
MQVQSSEATPWVVEYFERKTLAELGYVFSGDNLTDERVSIFNLIAATLAELERQQAKKVQGKWRKT